MLSLIKIAKDIRWLGSGTRCGIGELQLPASRSDSSIMPSKVNPVIAESLLMVCAQGIGHDSAIAWCAAAGNWFSLVCRSREVLEYRPSMSIRRRQTCRAERKQRAYLRNSEQNELSLFARLVAESSKSLHEGEPQSFCPNLKPRNS